MEKRFDLIVVGAGILGTFHAYHALEMGLRVALLEKDSLPMGATVRNFGQVIPSGLAGKWFDFGCSSLEGYRKLKQTAGIPLQENGSAYLASDAEEVQLLHELKAHYDTKGYPCSLLSGRNLQQKYPAIRGSYAREALHFPQELSLEPESLLSRLHTYMKSRFPGLCLQYRSPVTACTDTNDGAAAYVHGSKWSADKVVICNGAEVHLLFPERFAAPGRQVCKLQMMRTRPLGTIGLTGNMLTGLSIRRYESFSHYCPSYRRLRPVERYRALQEHGIHILFNQAPDGSLLIGDSHRYAHPKEIDTLGYGIDLEINERILQEAGRIVELDLRHMASTWAGYYYLSEKAAIVEEAVSEDIHIRTGLGGKGMTTGIGYALASLQDIMG
ncbi:TIGR03364 family FAD-dependent oxidoreductase [Cyclobacterium xiamenense]|uniref:TIGR03364 family FAD-dependent oxidoreductase n=1 Tax=Cyclobacterium xiamenense TaxID=1297121 RepID=UPI0012B82CCD|nr:TIGR03364 family FAD-dependent oxidoreductase [Cyclobacterium xiamenense]